VRRFGAYPVRRARRELFRTRKISDGIMSSILVMAATNLSLITYSQIMNLL
jgi:hypothetical protein